MKCLVDRIPDLEFELIRQRGKRFCFEVEITEEGKLSCELVSRNKLRDILSSLMNEAFRNESTLIAAVKKLLAKRSDVLNALMRYERRLCPTILEEFEEKPPRKMGEKEEGRKEETPILEEVPLPELGEEEAVEEERCLELIAREIRDFEELISEYLQGYENLCRLCLENFKIENMRNRDKALEVVSGLANIDIVRVTQPDLKGSILVPLDISPQRLALALNPNAVLDESRTDSFYIPPVVTRIVNGREAVFHAYRSVDDYPVLFPAIHMEEREIGKERETRFYNETVDATKLLYRLKKGRRGIRYPLSELAQVLALYFNNVHIAKDKFLLVDLGCGRGGTLKSIINKFITDYASQILDESTWIVVLNDLYEEERTGEEFISFASSDRASQYIRDVRKFIGDMRETIKRLRRHNLNFDICLINRVFDMYGKYGFYSVKEATPTKPSAAIAQYKDIEGRGRVLVYKDLARFNNLYNLQRQLLKHEEPKERVILQGVSYDLQRDFFRPEGPSLEDLLEVAKLVIITIFPATKETTFANLIKEGMYIYSVGEKDISTKPRYVIFCLSKDKSLIDAIQTSLKS